MTDHDHSDPGHSHTSNNERKIAIAAMLTGSFMFAEVFGGIVSGSLALIADAGHMLTDFASLVLAWFAFRLARRPTDWKRTYGFDRFSVLAALVNGLSLFAIAIWITFEAIRRFSDPPEILGGLMLWVALAGLLVNVLAFWMLTRGESNNLNIRAATLHVAGDLLGSVAALVASLVIIYTGWTPIDPILSVFVVLLILKSAYKVIMESTHILLEAAPAGFDSREVARILVEEIEDVASIDHVHAWSVTQDRPMATMEVRLQPKADAYKAKQAIRSIIGEQFKIEHVTIEIIN